MTNGRLRIRLIFTLTVAPTILFAQESAKQVEPHAHMLSVSADQTHSVTIQIGVSSGTKSIVAPICEQPDGTMAPCWITVQAATEHGWHTIRPRYSKLGMVAVEHWTAHTILPGESQDFLYRFIRNEWDVSQGQRIRVVVSVWWDEQSMRKVVNRFELKTQVFACP